jgi:hypothetical protein
MAYFLSAESLDAVYELAEESSSLGQVTKEALDVIESVFNEYG